MSGIVCGAIVACNVLCVVISATALKAMGDIDDRAQRFFSVASQFIAVVGLAALSAYLHGVIDTARPNWTTTHTTMLLSLDIVCALSGIGLWLDTLFKKLDTLSFYREESE